MQLSRTAMFTLIVAVGTFHAVEGALLSSLRKTENTITLNVEAAAVTQLAEKNMEQLRKTMDILRATGKWKASDDAAVSHLSKEQISAEKKDRAPRVAALDSIPHSSQQVVDRFSEPFFGTPRVEKLSLISMHLTDTSATMRWGMPSLLAGVVIMAAVVAVSQSPGAAAALAYLCTSVSIDLAIAFSKAPAHQQKDATAQDGPAGDIKNAYLFNPLCSIACVETGKLIVSLALAAYNGYTNDRRWRDLIPDTVDKADVCMMAFPAALFTLNNLLVFLAIGNNPVSTFGAFRETGVLWTALIWCFIFKTSLGWSRIVPLCALTFGLVMNQIPDLMESSLSWMVILVCIMTLSNALGSVSNEYVLKRTFSLDLNLQNAFLYAWCITFTIIGLALYDPSRLTSFGVFTGGFTRLTWTLIGLQMFAGLMVSRLLKYASSVHKSVVSALRGPVLVGISPLLGLHSRSDVLTLASTLVVGASAAYFLNQGKPSAEKPVDTVDKVLAHIEKIETNDMEKQKA